jgi:molybdopterin-guanine dinucleotide biosynthesis protein A
MITIAIQAGGQSSRMGQDKALIHLAGKPMIEHVLARVRGLGNEVLITTNRPQEYAFLGVRMASDKTQEKGSLVGLHTALAEAKGETVLVLACDMPFVNRQLLEYLLDRAPLADVVVPRSEGNYEPLHAVYNRHSCLPAVCTALAAGEKQVISFFPMVQVLDVEDAELDRLDPERLSFFNINTPEDLAEAECMLSKGA